MNKASMEDLGGSDTVFYSGGHKGCAIPRVYPSVKSRCLGDGVVL